MGRTIHCSGTPFRCDLPDQGRRKAQPKVVHVIRLCQYHGPGQYIWEDSGKQSPTIDEDQARDPGRTQDHTEPGNPAMNQEEEHCFLLPELDVTGEGDQSEDVTEVAAPREDSEDNPVRRRQQRERKRLTKVKYVDSRDTNKQTRLSKLSSPNSLDEG
ncbi:hypothetical protein Hamer_G013191 [Homarus americanus]|uniref:Uncharacterized protein n=1 Tax=Homarus americanus TaxID=6706 RepID=A0A8J5K183_HOMAM|nr:hypothetical protein Hamer_G013191 [Homarus americanus]